MSSQINPSIIPAATLVPTQGDARNTLPHPVAAPAVAPAVAAMDSNGAGQHNDTNGNPGSSMADVREAVKRANQAVQRLSRSVEFTVDEDTKKVIVRIVDDKTNDVIRQIPSEEMLALSRSLDQLQGLLFNQRV